MIHETDLKRNGVENNQIKIERKLRRQEGLNTFEMMLQLTNEIKKLGEANQKLCQKLNEVEKALYGKSTDSTQTEKTSGQSTETSTPEK